MALPLPRVIPDVGPGGGLVTAMGGMNALANALHQTKYNKVKADWAPTTIPAQAYSQLAYANAVGPQFMAKLMQDPKFMGNLSEPQRQALAGMQYNFSTQPKGFDKFNQDVPHSGIGQPSTNSFSGRIKNALHDLFGRNNTGNAQSPMQQQNMPQQVMPQQPSHAFQNPPQQAAPQSQGQNPADEGVNADVIKASEEWRDSPEGQRELAKANRGEGANIPSDMLAWKRQNDAKNNKSLQMTMNTGIASPKREKTYQEKGGEYEGTYQEGVESGKIRAKDREALNNIAFNAKTSQGTLDQISDILATPEFESIRSTPLAGHSEIDYYAKEGTPAQQEMIGKYNTLTGELIKNASRDFAGQFRKGEQSLLTGMKPAKGDTVDVAKGKTETLSVLNKMLGERAALTSKLMREHHIDKLDASEAADKIINGDKIRQAVHDRLYPTITLRDPKKPSMTITLPIAEARKRGYNG